MVGPRRNRVSRWSSESDPEEPDVPPWDRAEERRGRPQLPGGTETILLVEDEPEVLDATRAILERLGYAVVTAVDSREALGIADAGEGPPDLLLTDVVLPSRSGIAMAERLLVRWPRMPVLYMSAFTSHHVLPDDGSGRRRAFLQKPYTLEGLARKVRALLDGTDG